MPSSPGPPDYTRETRRFFYRGISLTPQDALADGKQAWGLNIRSYEEGTLEPRYGSNLLTADAVDASGISSLARLNDTGTFGIAAPAQRFLGTPFGALYVGVPGIDAYALLEAGYSGDPLSFVTTTPASSPRPYLYVFDQAKQRKYNTSLDAYTVGLQQPNDAPTAVLAAPQLTFMNTIGAATWVAYGPNTTPAPAPLVAIDRVNTTITQLLYDLGTSGMASVAVADFNNVTAGMTLDLGAGPSETIIVHSVHPPVSPTTIAAIIYDSGVTGLCTIQPSGSFSVGQIEAALPLEVERRYKELGDKVPPRVTFTRTVDFPVDSLVLLNGVEVVRILSVAYGPDGTMSFRANTLGTYTAAQTIAGISCFRAYLHTTRAVGDAAVALALEVTVTPATTAPEVGGVQAPFTGPVRNWALVGTKATQPQDLIRFGIKVSELGYVQAVRLVLDLSPTGPEFLRDYLFYEWRASDLVTAIQATSEATTGLMSTAQADAVQAGLTNALYGNQYGQDAKGVIVTPDQGGKPRAGQEVVGQAVPRTAADGVVSLGGGLSRQLALGNEAWMTLECRVGDLTRVGTDTTLTIGAMQNVAIYVQVADTTNAIDVQVSDGYLIGGYGPDIGLVLPPYAYRHSYRSTLTGEQSNVSPPTRAGAQPRRGRVTLTVVPSTDPQATVIDFWRFGGALARWTYVGTTPNSTPTFNDDFSDSQIDGGQVPRQDLFQPWPTSDLPRSGTCNVSGTAIEWVSGDLFDVEWSPNSLIIINGRATALYRSPSSTTLLEVIDNCYVGSAVPFSLPSPTLLAQKLPYVWGGFINDVWFTFGAGDPQDPGVLHWTHGNNPDASGDANVLFVSSASEPLMGGYFDADGQPYVFSTEKLYRLQFTPGSISTFAAFETGCQRGLWTPWFFCRHPDGGTFFGSRDGIYYTVGGGPAQSLTDPDLKPMFPQEGSQQPFGVRNLNPIDWSVADRLRLSFINQVLYFDYLDIEGESHTLVYEPKYQRWTPDAYAAGTWVRLGEPGPQVETELLAGVDGRLRQVDAASVVDSDINGELAAMAWAIWTPWDNGRDPRSIKQYGDAILDMNPGGTQDGIQVTPVIDNGNVAMTPQLLGIGQSLRDTYLVEVGTGGELGYGVLTRNFGLWIQGACQVCDTQRPIFYLWEPAFLPKGTTVARRATDWDDLGYKGAKFVQGVMIRANTFAETKDLEVQYDGSNVAPIVAQTLPINHDGERLIAYPKDADGWSPFIAELVRLQGADDVEWTLLDWRFVWEPAPELATQWETQYTTFDYPGFVTVFDGIVAYQSTAAVTWFVEYQDGFSASYLLPSSAGAYRRARQICAPQKGKAVRFRWTSPDPFRLFKRDMTVRVQAWGAGGGYQFQQPFGGPSREDGAGI